MAWRWLTFLHSPMMSLSTGPSIVYSYINYQFISFLAISKDSKNGNVSSKNNDRNLDCLIAAVIFNASKVKQKLRLAELSAKSKTPIQSDKKVKQYSQFSELLKREKLT